jgi:hypothetical protein
LGKTSEVRVAGDVSEGRVSQGVADAGFAPGQGRTREFFNET